MEARTQASVALFKLGAHSATLRPEFGGPKSLRCCCAKGVGHRAQLMLRARRGDRENNHPVPLLRTPTPQKLSLSCPHSGRGVPQLPSPSTSCHVADRERISSCSARRVAKAKVLPEPPGALTTWRRSPFYVYLLRSSRGCFVGRCAARPAVRGGAPSLSSVAELVGGCVTTGGSRQQSSGEPTRMSNQRWDSL